MPSNNLRLTIPVTPPGTMGTTKGGHIFIEAPDVSSNLTARMDGVTIMDGSYVMQGDWAPLDYGKFPYVAGEQPWSLEVYTGLDPQVAHDIRVYVSSYSDEVDTPLVRYGSPGATPSVVVTVPALTQAKPNSGSNVTPWLVTGISAVVGSAVTVAGKLRRPITVTVDLSGLSAHRPTDWAYQLIGYVDGDVDNGAFCASGYLTQDGDIPSGPDGLSTLHTFLPEEPTEATSVTIYAVAGRITGDNYVPRRNGNYPPGTFLPNNIVPGITASCVISLGTTTGVLDPTQNIASLLDTSVGVNNAVFGVLPLGVDNVRIALLAVDTAQLAALATTSAKLATAAVDTSKIAALAVDAVALAAGAVTNPKLAALAVDAGILASGAVTTPKFAALAVDAAAMATGAITTPKLAALAVDAAALAGSAVTSTKIASAAVGTAAIANAAITSALIGSAAVGTAAIANAAITSALIGSAAVGTAAIANAAITSALIGSAAVGSAAIAAAAVGTAAIATAAITTALIANASITNALIANLAVSTAQIQNLAVTNAKINDLDVSKLNAGTISVAVSLTSPTITITSGTLTINLDALNWLKVTDTGLGAFSQVKSSTIRIESTGNSGWFGQLGLADLFLTNNAGNVFRASPTSMIMQGLPSSSPGAGTKQFWYDPADANRVKFAA